MTMDLERLRALRKGERLRIDGHIYAITQVTGEAVYAGGKDCSEKDYVAVFQLWMRRQDDNVEFMLHVPQDEDRPELVVLHRVVHSHLGTVMNVPLTFKKLEKA
jgi:hypothetical protein